MKDIKTLIKQNKDEITDLLISYLKEKSKKTKSPKTICHFKALGKKYTSNIFTRNYEEFLLDSSKLLSYDQVKDKLKGFVRPDVKDFPPLHEKKSTMIKLHNGGIVSSYSSTEKKLKHIEGICELLNVNLEVLN